MRSTQIEHCLELLERCELICRLRAHSSQHQSSTTPNSSNSNNNNRLQLPIARSLGDIADQSSSSSSLSSMFTALPRRMTSPPRSPPYNEPSLSPIRQQQQQSIMHKRSFSTHHQLPSPRSSGFHVD